MSAGARPSPLFTPFKLGRLCLRNRIAMAPMTREAAPGGVPTPEMASYYARRAEGGTGLIITEGVAPDPAGCFGAAVPRLFGKEAVAGWCPVVEAVHAEGAAIFAQIWHVGAFSPSMIGMADSLPPGVDRLSPSGLAAPGRPFGRAMRDGDIADTIRAFADAAAAARSAGFDGVEIHGAHGYLIDQFLCPETNRRDDQYGPASRTRFAVELVRAVRRAAGPDFPIGFRLSQWKQLDFTARLATDPSQLAALVEPLADAGVDLFHCSTRRFWEPEFDGDDRTLAAWVKALSGRPTITVGSVTLGVDFKAPGGKALAETVVGHVARLERGIEQGWFDLVAIGRSLLANADWVRLVSNGAAAELKPFKGSMLEALI